MISQVLLLDLIPSFALLVCLFSSKYADWPEVLLSVEFNDHAVFVRLQLEVEV